MHMETGLCVLMVLLCCGTLGAATFPNCLNVDVIGGRMKCFSWSYNENTEECTFVNSAIYDLYPGVGFGTDFINQPGYFAMPTGTYANEEICKWHIAPKSPCHTTAFLLLTKNFHDGSPTPGVDCPIKDHLQLQYSDDQFDYYCGDSTTDNCPVNNCPSQNFIISDGLTNVTFRSDDSGKATGFLAMVVNDIEIDGCNKKRRSYSRMKVPINSRCYNYSTASRSRQLPCECFGNCTVRSEERKDLNQLGKFVREIIFRKPNEAKQKAFSFVNTEDQILRSIVRRIVKNIEIFGVAVPTTTQRVDYTWRKLDQCEAVKSMIKENPKSCPHAYQYVKTYDY